MIYHDRSIVAGVKLSQTTSLGGHHLEKNFDNMATEPSRILKTSLASHLFEESCNG
jgi:hypothetical protein